MTFERFGGKEASVQGDARILVIGPTPLSEAVARAVPRCRSTAADGLLNGLWTIGQHEFDGIVVSLSAGRTVLRGIRSLREVAQHARIVVTCCAADEPHAREALDAGADEYVLEPVVPEDLAKALAVTACAPIPVGPAAGAAPPSMQERVQLGEVLKHLSEGFAPMLARLARLLCSAFGAESASVQVDDVAASAGTASAAPVLEELLRRQDEAVGRIALGRRAGGTYSTADATRLADYARLVETLVTQAREQARWQELAWQDDLSGLRNRRYFETALDRLLTRATAERLRLTVVLFDIDDFKTYNDRYGHETGDALIQEVATLLTRCSRESDVVVRYGGDEFAVVLWDAEQPRVPGSQHPTEAMALAERFRAVIREHAFKCLGADAPGPVTLSGGLATFPWDGKTRPELVRAADAALLLAKRNGKNRIALAEPRRAAEPSQPVESRRSARTREAPADEGTRTGK